MSPLFLSNGTFCPTGAYTTGAHELMRQIATNAEITKRSFIISSSDKMIEGKENFVWKDRHSNAYDFSIESLGAEREGFEPSVRLPAQRFSRPPHSAALASLPIIGVLLKNIDHYKLEQQPPNFRNN